MWWQWFQPESDRIAQKIALSAMWNEGYQAGYQVAFNQNRCDCGQVHRCSQETRSAPPAGFPLPVSRSEHKLG
jgi:hypothetical protein